MTSRTGVGLISRQMKADYVSSIIYELKQCNFGLPDQYNSLDLIIEEIPVIKRLMEILTDYSQNGIPFIGVLPFPEANRTIDIQLTHRNLKDNKVNLLKAN